MKKFYSEFCARFKPTNEHRGSARVSHEDCRCRSLRGLDGPRRTKGGEAKRVAEPLLASEPVTQRFSPSPPTLHYLHVQETSHRATCFG